MPLQVFVDATRVIDRLDNMYDDIKQMKVDTLPEQFLAWETEDMHRKYPEMTFHPGEEEAACMTRIWPRSRDEMPGGKKRLFTIPKDITRSQIQRFRLASAQVHHTGRPILRPELFEQLHQRMRTMLLTLHWRRSSAATESTASPASAQPATK